MNKRRIVNWFTYTILCALLPMVITFIIRTTLITQDNPPYNYAGELLLFTVMVAATSLGDIKDLRVEIGGDIFLDIFFSVMLLLLLVSAILYGCNVIADNTNISIIDIDGKVLKLSGAISAVSGILGTIIQVIIAKSEGE